MNPNHKWYRVAKQWVEGAQVQFRESPDSPWYNWKEDGIWSPSFTPEIEWRAKQVHQDLIDAQAEGKVIEWLSHVDDKWRTHTSPLESDDDFVVGYQYRVKPDKWAKEKEAYAKGKKIQYRSRWVTEWSTLSKWDIPKWIEDEDSEYRAEPDVIMVERAVTVDREWGQPLVVNDTKNSTANIRYTFDADTSELLQVEMI